MSRIASAAEKRHVQRSSGADGGRLVAPHHRQLNDRSLSKWFQVADVSRPQRAAAAVSSAATHRRAGMGRTERAAARAGGRAARALGTLVPLERVPISRGRNSPSPTIFAGRAFFDRTSKSTRRRTKARRTVLWPRITCVALPPLAPLSSSARESPFLRCLPLHCCATSRSVLHFRVRSILLLLREPVRKMLRF